VGPRKDTEELIAELEPYMTRRNSPLEKGGRNILVENTTAATTQKMQSLLMKRIFTGERKEARLEDRLFAVTK